MDIRAAEISSVIKDQIANFETKADVAEVGTVLSVGDGIARVYGLDKVQAGEMVEFPGGIKGMALNLEMDNVGIIHVDDGFGRAYARTYTEAYGAENICATISYPSNTLDFEDPANAIVSAGCANAMIATHVSDGAMLIDLHLDTDNLNARSQVGIRPEVAGC